MGRELRNAKTREAVEEPEFQNIRREECCGPRGRYPKWCRPSPVRKHLPCRQRSVPLTDHFVMMASIFGREMSYLAC